jgi:hypothetical protein
VGCQSSCVIGNNLTFSICTHDPDTGVLTDATSVTYRVYEDETAAAILNGTMAKLDDANTTGLYTELLAVTAGNGFDTGKSYTVYIEATVDGDTGGISYGFTVSDVIPTKAEMDTAHGLLATPAQVNTQVLDVLNTDTFAEPGDEAPAATTTLVNKIGYLFKFLRNKVETTATRIHVYDDAGTNKDHSSTISDDATTFTRGEFRAGDV